MFGPLVLSLLDTSLFVPFAPHMLLVAMMAGEHKLAVYCGLVEVAGYGAACAIILTVSAYAEQPNP